MLFLIAVQVRYIGLSNETAFGVMQFIRAAEEHGLPRVVSIQVPLSSLSGACFFWCFSYLFFFRKNNTYSGKNKCAGLVYKVKKTDKVKNSENKEKTKEGRSMWEFASIMRSQAYFISFHLISFRSTSSHV